MTSRRDDHLNEKLAALLLQREVEDFIVREAALLDEWRLDDWLALFTEDARYLVPATDLPAAEPKETLAIINDDMARLRGRVERLKSRHAHREFPWSRTRRFITNVRIGEMIGEEMVVQASFLVYRIRSGQVDPLIGSYVYTLRRLDGALKIAARKAVLDLEALRPHGTLSIIL
ncbi:MAG TPA: aromatic-ring-hydroxylating dioxygenase subunit beta [Candidatus Binatia bacterium]|nr:aromatic-ring-hydroxylating dioxygenase subunit beta [Candidatus Binatia bacterium]